MNWSQCLTYWNRHTQVAVDEASALEVGTGSSGGLSLWLASLGCQVTATDTHRPTPTTELIHRRYGHYQPQMSYLQLDALDIPFTDTFDVVAFKSVLGAIGRGNRFDLQCEAIVQMHKALKPDGELWFAENLMGTRVHASLRNSYGAGRGNWRYIGPSELGALLSPFREVTYRTAGLVGLFGRTERQRTVLGTADRLFLSRIAPDRFRYFVMGVARK